MTKILKVEICEDCRYFDTDSGFSTVAWTPKCTANNSSRPLDHVVLCTGRGRAWASRADVDRTPPSWCSLEDLPE